MSVNEIVTLNSLEQVDDFPLYTMRYQGAYVLPTIAAASPGLAQSARHNAPAACPESWGCALFAALGDPGSRLYGRNFDWRFSPALLLFTDPPDGYASVSMVDLEYLGFGGSASSGLAGLPFSERRALLEAPAWPFDGMNEKGLVVGMAAVEPGDMQPDPDKNTLGNIDVMREILDHAATVDEAVAILEGNNIEMGTVSLHYLVASASGDSALVEFYQGKVVVFKNENPWQHATNFILASMNGNLQGECPRFDRITSRLQETAGQLTVQDAFTLLAEVSQNPPQAQSPTQWSVVYDMTVGTVHVVMGRKYTEGAYTLQLQ